MDQLLEVACWRHTGSLAGALTGEGLPPQGSYKDRQARLANAVIAKGETHHCADRPHDEAEHRAQLN